MKHVQRLHQFVVGASYGDAIYNQATILQKWLQARGWESKIYAEHIHIKEAHQVWPYTAYQPATARETVILHYSIGSPMLYYLLSYELRFIMIYHNLTPPRLMNGLNTSHKQLLQVGIELLPYFAQQTCLALADSEYNRRDLLAAGFASTGVLPVPFDEEAYRQPPDPGVLERFDDDFVNLLFVGRIVPNKRMEDVLKVFYYYRQINPRARLFLVGAPLTEDCRYYAWLKEFIKESGLKEVYLTGYVPVSELLAYYQLTDVYVSMSEHEGYGVPLMESIYFDVPVLAYKASAVPDTLGRAGLQIAHKNYPFIAELIEQLVADTTLRQRVISQQRQRLADMSLGQIKRRFDAYIEILWGKS